MKICTWNVNGIRARHLEVSRLAAEHRPDILCLQEIKATSAQIPEPLTLLPEYASLWHGAPGGYSGVSLHVLRGGACAGVDAALAFSHPSFDFEGRMVEVQLDGLRVASVYVPNGGKDFPAKLSFMEAFASHIREQVAAGLPYVICGDLNVAHTDADLHPRHRKAGAIGQSPAERALFSEWLAAGLVDVVRSMALHDDQLFTWWPPWRQEKAKNRGWRIDYLLATPSLRERAVGFEILTNFGTSDHAPLIVTFS